MDLIDTLEDMAENTADYTNTNVDKEFQERQQVAVELLLSMEPFREGGEYHNLAQPTEIDISEKRTVYLDLQQIPENSDDLGVMMQLLFMNIYQEAKRTDNKVALTIDESHKIMSDSGIVGGLEEMFRHSRHFDLSINLISQTPEEFYATETAKTISKQCTIKRFHRVDKLDTDVAEDILDMNQQEINYIENAEMGEGNKDFSQALLQISDEDMSIPLRIYATKDEKMIIGYDPTENVEDYNEPQAQSLKQALDIKDAVDVPRYVGDDDELATEVRAAIAKKKENRDRIAEKSIESQQHNATSSENGEIQTQDDTHGGEEGAAVWGDKNEPTVDDNTSSDDSDNSDPYENLRRRIGGVGEVDDIPERNIKLIATQHDVADRDDSVEVIRAKIKNTVYDANVSIPDTHDDTDDTDTTDTETLSEGGEAAEGSSTPPESQSNQSQSPNTPTESGSVDGQESIDEGDSETEIDSSDTDDLSQGDDGVSVDSIEDCSEEEINKLYYQYVAEDDETLEAKRKALSGELGITVDSQENIESDD
jgi:hypothetical protein